MARSCTQAAAAVAACLVLSSCSGTDATSAKDTSADDGIGGGTVLTFPLAGQNARTAQINSVFDHSMTHAYVRDKVVTAFNGVVGTVNGKDDCYGQAGGAPISLGSLGTYRGTLSTQLTARLCYDDHPGIDYYADYGTPIFPAISGTVSYTQDAAGAVAALYHVLTIVPDNPSGYRVQYMHLSTWWDGSVVRRMGSASEGRAITTCNTCPRPGDRVTVGQATPIGYTGDFSNGVPVDGNAHLHFEVHTPAGVPVDPYGWHGSGPDPYTAATSVDLWSTPQLPTYSVSVNASPANAGTISGGGSYTANSNVTVNATPASGFGFVNWTENGSSVSSSASYSFTATGNRNLTANFTGSAYSIGLSASPANGGTVSGAGSYIANNTATVVATPNTGFTFVSWTENGSVVSSSPTYSFTVSGSRQLVANFSNTSYSINLSANPASGGTVGGSGSYVSGASVTARAFPNAGYSFINWTENGGVVSTNPSYAFTATSNRSLVANFGTSTYAINATSSPSNAGTVSGSGNYTAGSNVTLVAIPASGYAFTSWTENGAVVSTSATYTFTANGSRNLVANFNTSTYAISVIASPSFGGTVSGGGSYSANSSVTVSAFANQGYTFTNWTENGSVVSTNPSYTFTATSSRSLTANFSSVAYNVSLSASPSSGGTVTGAGSYSAGAFVTVRALPNQGYTFTSWTENGSVVSTNSSYSFTAAASRSLVANFSSATYTVSLSASPSNGGSATGSGSYSAGAFVTVIAFANSGFAFGSWTENGTTVSTSSSYSFTVNSNRTLIATFNAQLNRPAAPTNVVAAVVSAGTVRITWNDNSNNEDSFKLERAQSSGGPWTLVGNLSANFTLGSDSPPNGGVWYYRVSACNSAGCSDPAISQPVSLLLSAPTLLSPSNIATNVSRNPTFSWTSVPGADRYWLMVATTTTAFPTDPNATSCPGCVVSGNTTGATSYTVPGNFPIAGRTATLAPNTTYYWIVQAWSSNGTQGNYSSFFVFRTGN